MNPFEQTMNIVFNSPQLYIIDYPVKDAVEIFDRRHGRLGLIQGAVAQRFRREFGALMENAPDEEKFDALMDTYDSLMHQPITVN